MARAGWEREAYDAVLHFLDRQIVDVDGALVANVDDLEVSVADDGTLTLTALLVGPGALGPRFGGRLGRWVVAIWRRLRADADPQPGRIPLADVTGVDSAVHVRQRRRDTGVDGFERWVLDSLVSRIPGAGHDPE